MTVYLNQDLLCTVEQNIMFYKVTYIRSRNWESSKKSTTCSCSTGILYVHVYANHQIQSQHNVRLQKKNFLKIKKFKKI